MKTYLVALDTSPVAGDVLAAAVELAQKTDAQLVLLRSVGLPLELPSEAYVISPDNVTELLVTNARKDLNERGASLPPGLLSSTVVEIGTAWRSICETAATRNVDLIIVGAHGHRFMDRVLGTTTSRVVSHAERSVYIVWPKHPA